MTTVNVSRTCVLDLVGQTFRQNGHTDFTDAVWSLTLEEPEDIVTLIHMTRFRGTDG